MEFLVIAIDRHHQTKDSLCYKRGDVIYIAEDGWGWGNEELKSPANGGTFCIIKVPNVPKSNHLFLLMEHENGMRRKARLDIDRLKPLQRDVLRDFGTLVLAESELLAIVHDKTT